MVLFMVFFLSGQHAAGWTGEFRTRTPLRNPCRPNLSAQLFAWFRILGHPVDVMDLVAGRTEK
jgi:hypothetical protein